MDHIDRTHAHMARASIAYATACIAPDRRKRTGYGWTVAIAIIALALVGMGWR